MVGNKSKLKINCLEWNARTEKTCPAHTTGPIGIKSMALRAKRRIHISFLIFSVDSHRIRTIIFRVCLLSDHAMTIFSMAFASSSPPPSSKGTKGETNVWTDAYVSRAYANRFNRCHFWGIFHININDFITFVLVAGVVGCRASNAKKKFDENKNVCCRRYWPCCRWCYCC